MFRLPSGPVRGANLKLTYGPTGAISKARLALGSRIRGKWFLGLRLLGDTQGVPPDMTGFRIIAAPPGRFYADPFLLEHNGRHFLLFEDGSLADGKGRIVYCEIYEDTSVSLPAVALERDYHVSYPFPFVTEDQLLMVPETSDRSAIEVFRAKGFPGAFTPCCTLMKDCRLVDPTIVRWAGKLWLFAHTDPRVRSDFEGLHLFYADGVFGPWHPHPMNPVVCDAGSARPAGAVFELDDRLVRPAQDCSLRYGHQIVFNCIEQLDLSAYREREIGRITSEWLPDSVATHTYNRSSRFEVVDGQWFTSDMRWFDLAVRGMSRFVHAPVAAGTRGRAGWRIRTEHFQVVE